MLIFRLVLASADGRTVTPMLCFYSWRSAGIMNDGFELVTHSYVLAAFSPYKPLMAWMNVRRAKRRTPSELSVNYQLMLLKTESSWQWKRSITLPLQVMQGEHLIHNILRQPHIACLNVHLIRLQLPNKPFPLTSSLKSCSSGTG